MPNSQEKYTEREMVDIKYPWREVQGAVPPTTIDIDALGGSTFELTYGGNYLYADTVKHGRCEPGYKACIEGKEYHVCIPEHDTYDSCPITDVRFVQSASYDPDYRVVPYMRGYSIKFSYKSWKDPVFNFTAGGFMW
jgi:hypothetical protein